MKKSEKPVFRDDHTELEKFMIAREDVDRIDREKKGYKAYVTLDIIADIFSFFSR